MFKNPFEKFADKLLGQDKRGQELKKYNIDLSGVLGEGIDQEELQHNEMTGGVIAGGGVG